MRAEMHAQESAITSGQHFEIAARFRRLDDTEGVFLVRHLEVVGVVASDLQEHAGVRAALVGLPGRMKEPRPKAETGSDPLAITNQDAYILERIAITLIALYIGEQRAIVAPSDSLEMGCEILHECLGLPECFAVLLVGKERKAGLLQQRCFRRQLPGPLVCGRELACLDLAGLDVRLVEWIDAED